MLFILYDDLYNITKVYLNDDLINEYTYDNINELIEEINYILGRKYTYTYDSEGNILRKREFTLEDTLINEDVYEYSNSNWEDQLTKFNDKTITYDNIGNPVTIGTSNLTWENGRELKTYTDNNLTINYEYNIDGIRTSKTVNGTKTEYYLENSNIILEKTGNNVIYYIRDEKGDAIGFAYNNTKYYYKKNFQGDVLGIYDSNYNLIVNYTYDSWGKLISITDSNNNVITDTTNIGYINPIRYRSYYYDSETKLYYLNSRYYNPEWGRFINCDTIISLKSSIQSLYTYCNNNPINAIDSDGKLFLLVTALVGAVTGAVIGGIAAGKKGKSVVKGALVGAGVGALVGAAAGAIASYALTGTALSSTTVVLGTTSYKLAATGTAIGSSVSKALDRVSSSYEKVHSAISGNTNIYRAVSASELENISTSEKFSTISSGMSAKQFGFSFNETYNYYQQYLNEYTGIVKTSVPNNQINSFYTGTVDAHIFKTGTLTVYEDVIDLFNEIIGKISQIL